MLISLSLFVIDGYFLREKSVKLYIVKDLLQHSLVRLNDKSFYLKFIYSASSLCFVHGNLHKEYMIVLEAIDL